MGRLFMEHHVHGILGESEKTDTMVISDSKWSFTSKLVFTQFKERFETLWGNQHASYIWDIQPTAVHIEKCN
jgi:hypothetical protein